MSETIETCPGCRLTVEQIEAVRQAQSETGEPAGVLPMKQPSGKPEKLLLVDDGAAEELAGALGYFGGPLAVKIFAAVSLADLCLHDLARAVDGDAEVFRAELAHLEESNFVYRREIGGVEHFAAGNPPLRRFFVKRFDPGKSRPG